MISRKGGKSIQRRDREGIKRIDGKRIKGKMKRRFENVLNDRILKKKKRLPPRLYRKMHDGIRWRVGPSFPRRQM